MEFGDATLAPSARGDWSTALRGWRENPLYVRLNLSRRRQAVSANKLGKYAPLLIAMIPAGLTLAGMLVSTYNPTAQEMADALKASVVAFAITACVVWFAQGFHQTVLDCMLLLNRSQRRQTTVTVDDLAAVSGLSDTEIAVGTLAAVLPGLWLRIFVTVLCAVGVFIAVSTDFLTYVDNEHLLVMAYALPTVGLISLGGILASIALGLWIISMSENYSFSLASATAVLYSLGALFWLPASAGLTMFVAESTDISHGISGSIADAWAVAQVLAPAAYILLVWLALILARSVGWLRPVYALGSPWLNPVLMLISTVTLLAFGSAMFEEEAFGVAMMVFVYHWGTFAPLSLTHLPSLTMLGFETDSEGLMMQLGGYFVHLLTQALLILICARYAVLAIGARRQSALS